MVQIFVEYLGDLHCQVKHGPSGSGFLTDAPLDNQGKAEYISPTDLAAAALGSCILTIMGISARARNIDMDGTKVTVSKEMTNIPERRIKSINLDFLFPRKLSDYEFQILSAAVKNCPVTRSLHPDIEVTHEFKFAE